MGGAQKMRCPCFAALYCRCGDSVSKRGEERENDRNSPENRRSWDGPSLMHPLIEQMREELEIARSDGSEDRPKLHIDGKRVDLAGAGRLGGVAAKLCSVNAKTFQPIAARLDIERLTIVEMRGGDLADLECPRLTHLNITWATKLADVSALSRCSRLRYLELTDTPKVHDLSPLSKLANLRALVFQGGIWNRNRAQSLDPIADLPALEVLALLNLAVEEGGLRPLAKLARLKALFLSNQFETADYAYLSVHLPRTDCAQFEAYETLASEIGGNNVLVTGKRKPFLNTRDEMDRVRLEKYVAAFQALQAGFRAEIDRKQARTNG